MRKFVSLITAAALSSVAVTASAAVGPVDDATGFVATLMDQFNNGDAKGFIAAHDDNALIIDEFGQHVWTGAGSAQRWIDDYGKDATARGISEGRVDYGKPLAANGDANSVYVVLPTTYRFVQNGQKMSGAGSMTFIVHKAGESWKIASWTYAGATPAAEK